MTEGATDVLTRLWEGLGEGFGFDFDYGQFADLMIEVATSNGWNAEDLASLASLRVKELVLARACARGNEAAWEVFLTQYRDLLYSAAYAITKQDAAGRELADSLYADLFGISARDGQRQSKLASYTGRGSLAGWLRSVLAQRYVDEYRKARRQVSLEEQDAELLTTMPETSSIDGEVPRKELATSIGVALSQLADEDRFLLHAYYLDGRNLAEIAKLLGVHESTISRRLQRLSKSLKRQILKHLQASGLSRRAAEEALRSEVRDIDVNVRKLLQVADHESFHKVQTMEMHASSMLSTGEEG